MFLPCPPNCVRNLLCNLRSFNHHHVKWMQQSKSLETKCINLVQGVLINKNYIEKRRSHCPFHGGGFDRRMRSHDQQP